MDTPTVPRKARAGKQAEPVPPVQKKTRRIITIGVIFALLCAAAMSAPTLYALAEMAKFPKILAWLLPACLDGYAFTSILFGSRVPDGHPAKQSATKNTRLALALTVGSNGAFHLLVLAGRHLPPWVPIVLLVTVSSLPPFIVDRLLHLYSLANGRGATDTATPVATPAPTPKERQATVATPATATAPPVAAKVAPAPVEAANGNHAASNSNPPAKLMDRKQRLRVVRGLIDEYGKDVALAVIQDAVGGDKSTASRLRAAALAKPKPEADESEPEPERALELAGAVM